MAKTKMLKLTASNKMGAAKTAPKAPTKTVAAKAPPAAKVDTKVATEATVGKAEARSAAFEVTKEAILDAYEGVNADRMSVPVKPAASLKAVNRSLVRSRIVTDRVVEAIKFACQHQKVKIAEGAVIKRRFMVDGQPVGLEGGVSKRALSCGALEIVDSTPAHETFKITKIGFTSVPK